MLSASGPTAYVDQRNYRRACPSRECKYRICCLKLVNDGSGRLRAELAVLSTSAPLYPRISRILIIRAVYELRPPMPSRTGGLSAPETKVKGSTRIITPIVLVVPPLALTPFVPPPFPLASFFGTSVLPMPISPIPVPPFAVISLVPSSVALIVLIPTAVVAVLRQCGFWQHRCSCSC